MGKANRGKIGDKEGVPGPGSYESNTRGFGVGAVMGSGTRGPLNLD